MGEKGIVAAIYGVNNLGKSEQARRLADRMAGEIGDGKMVVMKKYPLYDLPPFGPAINTYLRKGNPHNLSAREIQLIQIANRTQVDRDNRYLIENGDCLVLEDYWGTGVAWGVGTGCDMNFLIQLNSHILKEDVAILLDGERFNSGREAGHRYEEDDDLTERVRQIHLELAERFSWHIINANQNREAVHKEIWSRVEQYLIT
jgi:thymidylate kinase